MTISMLFGRGALATMALAGLAFAACGGSSDDGDTATKAAASPKVATSGDASGGNAGAAASDEIEIKLTENKFAADKITVQAGKTITFKAKNEGAAVHNLKIMSAKTEGKDFASDVTIAPGKESKFTAKFTKKGTLQFQCDYHMPDMVGTIVVQ